MNSLKFTIILFAVLFALIAKNGLNAQSIEMRIDSCEVVMYDKKHSGHPYNITKLTRNGGLSKSYKTTYSIGYGPKTKDCQQIDCLSECKPVSNSVCDSIFNFLTRLYITRETKDVLGKGEHDIYYGSYGEPRINFKIWMNTGEEINILGRPKREFNNLYKYYFSNLYREFIFYLLSQIEGNIDYDFYTLKDSRYSTTITSE